MGRKDSTQEVWRSIGEFEQGIGAGADKVSLATASKSAIFEVLEASSTSHRASRLNVR